MKSLFLALLEFVWGLLFNKDKTSDKAHEINKKEHKIESEQVEGKIKEDITEKQDELENAKDEQEWIDTMEKRQSE